MNEGAPIDSELAAVRESLARALAFLRDHYHQKSAPEHAPFFTALAGVVLERALHDCQEIDARLIERGEAPEFVRDCSFTTWRAVASAEALARLELKVFQDGRSNLFSSDSAEAAEAIHLHRIREAYKDRGSMGLAIQEAADAIREMAAAGNMNFFRRLVEMDKDPPKLRGVAQWIYRAWLPLRLWAYPDDGQHAHMIMSRVGEILGRPEINSPEFSDFDKFKASWNGVKTRAMKGVFDFDLTEIPNTPRY